MFFFSRNNWNDSVFFIPQTPDLHTIRSAKGKPGFPCYTETGAAKNEHDHHSKPREFSIGQNVMAKNLRSGPKWISVVIDVKLGSSS